MVCRLVVRPIVVYVYGGGVCAMAVVPTGDLLGVQRPTRRSGISTKRQKKHTSVRPSVRSFVRPFVRR